MHCRAVLDNYLLTVLYLCTFSLVISDSFPNILCQTKFDTSLNQLTIVILIHNANDILINTVCLLIRITYELGNISHELVYAFFGAYMINSHFKCPTCAPP